MKKSKEDKKKQLSEEKQKDLDEMFKLLGEIAKANNSDEDKMKAFNELKRLSDKNKPSKIKMLFSFLLSFSISTILIYIISMCLIGFLYNNIVIENKYLIFLIMGIIAIILEIINIIYDNHIAYRLNHRYIIYALIIISLSVIGMITNILFYQIFDKPYIFLILIPAIMIVYKFIYNKSLSF